MASRKKNNKASIGCLFWIALILLVLVIFLFNRETIQNVLDETGFVEFIQNEKEDTPPEVEQVAPPENQPSQNDVEITETPRAEEPAATPIREPETDNMNNDETVIELEMTPAESTGQSPSPETVEADRKVRRSRMYFIEIHDDGAIELKDIVRPVYYEDSPLTETIKTLLEGLSSSELNMGLISLIPEETKLLSVSIKGGTAYINFSDSFRFNSFGIEGYRAQLKQIVYTATEFNNINSVQILIEGSLNEYMGPEGVFIGEPLSRNDFQD